MLVVIAVLAACGELEADRHIVSPTGAADDVDPLGVLRLPMDLTLGSGVSLDPVDPTSPVVFWPHYMVYDTLLRQREDGTYESGLASAVVVEDAYTIHVTLHEGVVFHDGEPLTASAVKRSILRTVAHNNSSGHRVAELSAIDEIRVNGSASLTIRLSTPTAGSFYNLLAHNETLVVSPKALDAGIDLATHPVGAGPFRVIRYDVESRIVMEKYSDYFQADEIRLAGVEILHIRGPAATVNALRSGTVDAAPADYETRREVRGTNLATRAVMSDGVLWYGIHCVRGNPALADVRVRQALNYATDGAAINNVIYGGMSEPMTQFFGSQNPYHNPRLSQTYRYDPDRARALLAAAGVTDLRLTIAVPSSGNYTVKVGEIVQQQWREVGVTVELVPSSDTVGQFYIGAQMDLFAQTQARSWTDKLMRTHVPGSVGAICVPTEPRFFELIARLRSLTPGDVAAIEPWHEIQEIVNKGAYGIFVSMMTVDNVWNPGRIGNPQWRRDQVGDAAHPDVWKVYIRKRP